MKCLPHYKVYHYMCSRGEGLYVLYYVVCVPCVCVSVTNYLNTSYAFMCVVKSNVFIGVTCYWCCDLHTYSRWVGVCVCIQYIFCAFRLCFLPLQRCVFVVMLCCCVSCVIVPYVCACVMLFFFVHQCVSHNERRSEGLWVLIPSLAVSFPLYLSISPFRPIYFLHITIHNIPAHRHTQAGSARVKKNKNGYISKSHEQNNPTE